MMADRSEEDALLDAAQGLLEARGWNLAVIGGIEVRHYLSDRDFNHELVVRFTGSNEEER